MIIHGGIVFDFVQGAGYLTSSDTLIYDFANETFTDSFQAVVGKLPIALQMHSASITDDDLMIVFGGTTAPSGANTYSYSDNIYTFDLNTNIWKQISSEIQPSRRIFVPSVLVGSDLYLFGGFRTYGEGAEYTNEFFALNLDSLEWRVVGYEYNNRTELAPPKAGHVAGNQ
jgi:hypothetical protein